MHAVRSVGGACAQAVHRGAPSGRSALAAAWRSVRCVHTSTVEAAAVAGTEPRTTGAAGSTSTASVAATADVAIIGAGIVGTGVALELARRGVSSVCIDKTSGPGQGSTSFSSGICRTYYSVLHSVQFSYEGYRVWQDWDEYVGVKDDRGMARLRECGGMILKSPDAAPFLAKTLPLHDQCGIPYTHLSTEDLLERFPYFDTSLFGPPKRVEDETFGEPHPTRKLDGGVVFPLSGYVSDPQLATLNLRTAAKAEKGGSLAAVMPFAEFQGLLYSGDRVAGCRVTTAAGTQEVHAPVVLNAAGPHSSVVNSRVFTADAPYANDMALQTRPFRVEVAHVHPPAGVDFSATGYVTMDSDLGIYYRPEVGNKIVCGSQEPICDHKHEIYPATPEDCPTALSDAWTQYVYRLATRIPSLPIPGASETQGIVAMYDVADDWTPIYDKSSIPGYYLAIGTSGNQFKNAGVIGGLVSELITSVEGGADQDSQPLQYPLAKTGAVLDTSKFSRLRSLLATSGSVLG